MALMLVQRAGRREGAGLNFTPGFTGGHGLGRRTCQRVFRSGRPGKLTAVKAFLTHQRLGVIVG